MCGRISESREPDEYFATIFTNMHGLFTLQRPFETHNVPPSSKPLVIHQLKGVPVTAILK